MTFLFYSLTGLVLLLFQTVLVPQLFGLKHFYDLFIPFILYLTLFRPFIEGIPVVLMLGLVLDSLSAGPFGLYGTSYIWLYFIIRWGVRHLHFGNFFLLPLVAALSVAVQNILFLGVLLLFGEGWMFSDDFFINIAAQLLWAGLTGPLFIAGFGFFQSFWIRSVGGGEPGIQGSG
jgi:cell shape-determining protein MreD